MIDTSEPGKPNQDDEALFAAIRKGTVAIAGFGRQVMEGSHSRVDRTVHRCGARIVDDLSAAFRLYASPPTSRSRISFNRSHRVLVRLSNCVSTCTCSRPRSSRSLLRSSTNSRVWPVFDPPEKWPTSTMHTLIYLTERRNRVNS